MSKNTTHKIPYSLVILVPDGVGVRNYLFSDVLSFLNDSMYKVVLLHRLQPEVVSMIHTAHPGRFEAIELPDLPETRGNDLLRRFCMFLRLHLNAAKLQNKSISENWFFFSTLRGRKKLFFRGFNHLAHFVSFSPTWSEKIENWLFSRMLKSANAIICKKILEKLSPDLLLCTHQRSIEAGYVITVANKLRIPTASVIFSWDNLPKTRNTYNACFWLVWSSLMKNELLHLYPKIEPQNVFVTGTPQFDIYRDKRIYLSKQQFYKKFGLRKTKYVFCFSGNEPSFPSDYLYLHDVLNALTQSALAEEISVLVRPSPNDHTGRLEKIAAQFPDIAKVAPPLWKRLGNRDWETNIPTKEDQVVLTNLVLHCDAVINIGSTMGLDFSHHNKPAINLAYNHPECSWFDITRGYEQEHLKTMKQLDATVMVTNRSKLSEILLDVLNHPKEIATERLVWRKLITDDIYPASKQVAVSIEEILLRLQTASNQ